MTSTTQNDRPGTFLRAYIRNPRTIGAPWPSSRGLARRMTEWVDWSKVRAVAEFGAGTGAITAAIVEAVRPNCPVVVIERDPAMAEHLRRRFPVARIVTGSVEDAREHCRDAGLEGVDVVISSLPWASLPRRVQARCMDAATAILGPHGMFATHAQLQGVPFPAGRRFARMLPRFFREVRRSPVVWRNAPPAFVYRCTHPIRRRRPADE